jgi:predicted dehydrogenase
MKKRNAMTRRELLRRAAAGAAAVAAPYVLTSHALGAPGTPPASDRVTLAVIGTGGRAGAFLSQSPILAVCDVDGARVQAAKQRVGGDDPGVKAYSDFREVLARGDIDAVVITAPDHWHCQMSAMAAKAGKDVYCEKPLSSYIAESRVLAGVLARSGTVFQTGSQQRSSGEFRLACELVRNGYIGELKKVTVGILSGKAIGPEAPEPVPAGFDYDLWLGPAPWAPYTKSRCHYNFRFQLDYAAGKLSDWGAHHLDIAQWGLGCDRSGPVEIEGQGAFPAEGIFDAATTFNFTCTYANGLKLYCSDKFPLGIRFDGREGSVFVTRGELVTQPASLRTVKLKPGEVHLYNSRNHWTNFIDCVRSRNETAAPVEVAHRTVSICHLANVAMLLGRRVRWDPAGEQFPGDDEANRMPMVNRARREPWIF